MTVSDSNRNPLRRISPYRGLVIDVPTWVNAHDYHRAHQMRHGLSMHSPGVIAGLDVIAFGHPDNSVMIQPGVAMDEDGHTIFVYERQQFSLQTSEEGVVLLVLQYREVPDEIASTPGEDEPRHRYILEAYRLEERRQPPEDPYVELARFLVSGTGKPIVNPIDPRAPRPDDIDLRYRTESGPRSSGEVAFGILSLEAAVRETVVAEPEVVPEAAEDEAGETGPEESSNYAETRGYVDTSHLLGMMNLIQAINSTTRYRADFRGAYGLDREIKDCHVLLMSGRERFNLNDQSAGFLEKFLDGGGVLLGEACGAGTNSMEGAVAFRQSFGELAKKMGKDLTPVDRGHSLLASLHFFSGMPEGVGGPCLMLADGGMMYSDGDYGCLWDGGWPEKPAPRESIRSAVELGINLGAYAAKHRARLFSSKGSIQIADRP